MLRRIVTYIGLYILPSSFFRQVLRRIVGERIATGRMGGIATGRMGGSTVGSVPRVGRVGGGGGGGGGHQTWSPQAPRFVPVAHGGEIGGIGGIGVRELVEGGGGIAGMHVVDIV